MYFDFILLGELTPCVAPCTDYGVVISTRGNSSRIKLSVYKFERKKDKMITPSDVTKIKASPETQDLDLDAIFKGTKSLPEAMMPLVTAAKKAVPVNYQLRTPILFSLDEEAQSVNEEAWYRLRGDIAEFYENKTVPFLAGPYSVEESNDAEDASYRWHAMNFIKGNFLGDNKKTVATLSFNGKMVSEVAYEILPIDNSVSYLSTIAGKSHPIVTSTYFRRGTLFALYKYFETISKPVQPVIESPCGPKGMKKEFKGIKGVKWIVGTGEIMKCRNIIREKLFNMCSRMNGCAYLKHKVKGEIYGMENVVQTMKQLGYEECTKDFTPLMLDAAIRKSCGGGEPNNVPETTVKPETTAQPETTAKPKTTPKPATTAKPETTVGPETTAQPVPTGKPETTAQPVPTVKPETTAQPIPTIKFPSKPPVIVQKPAKPPIKIPPIKVPNIDTSIKLPLKAGQDAKAPSSKGFPAKTSSHKRKVRSVQESTFEKRSIEGPTGITDCLNGNFLYMMLTEAYYLAPDTKIHVNLEKLPLEVDPNLGELLVRMQLL